MIRAIAVDDEVPALEVVKRFCEQTDIVALEKTFVKPSEALQYLIKSPVELLFLDINMPTVNGLQFYSKVGPSTMVIFTTAYSEYAVEGFNLSAVDYLLKPFTFERFMRAVEKAQEYVDYRSQKSVDAGYFFIRADYSLFKIDFNEVLYIEGFDDYIKVHLKDRPPIVARMTMKGILEKLPARRFMRIHRSFVVSLSQIEQVRNKTVTIAGKSIPVGASYEKEFNRQIGGQ